MTLPHLLNDKAMKTYFGPQSEVGDQRVYLAEQPFVTIQGEGPNIGKNTLFVRFFGCNLANSCGVDWCDTGHSFYTNKELANGEYPDKPDRITFNDVEEMYQAIFVNNGISEFHNVVFTGGEPMLWQITIAYLINALRDRFPRPVTVEIETNGTIPVETELTDIFRTVHINISPKIHVVKKFSLLSQLNNKPDTIGSFICFKHDSWALKFVYEGKQTKDLVEECITKYDLPKHRVYLMPEGITRDVQLKKMKECAEYCINKGYNFSARLHVIIWDIAKGI